MNQEDLAGATQQSLQALLEEGQVLLGGITLLTYLDHDGEKYLRYTRTPDLRSWEALGMIESLGADLRFVMASEE